MVASSPFLSVGTFFHKNGRRCRGIVRRSRSQTLVVLFIQSSACLERLDQSNGMAGRSTGRKDPIGSTVCSFGYGLCPLAILAARALSLLPLELFFDILKHFLRFILACCCIELVKQSAASNQGSSQERACPKRGLVPREGISQERVCPKLGPGPRATAVVMTARHTGM